MVRWANAYWISCFKQSGAPEARHRSENQSARADQVECCGTLGKQRLALSFRSGFIPGADARKCTDLQNQSIKPPSTVCLSRLSSASGSRVLKIAVTERLHGDC